MFFGGFPGGPEADTWWPLSGDFPGMGGKGGGRNKNVDTTKFYKLLEVDKLGSQRCNEPLFFMPRSASEPEIKKAPLFCVLPGLLARRTGDWR